MLQKLMLAAALTAPPAVQCEDIKLGFTATIGNVQELRVPVAIGNTLVEPFVSHYRNNSRTGVQPSSKTQSNSIGLGFWHIVPLEDNYYAQLGVQFAYEEEDRRYGSLNTYNDGVTYGYEDRQETSGYSIAPAAGLFYRLTERAEVGIEIKYYYADLDGKIRNRDIGRDSDAWQELETEDFSASRSQVRTQAVLRIFF